MIKKNDCVPKKVLNERKLRRQAIAVMIGGLVVAFLLGLITGLSLIHISEPTRPY